MQITIKKESARGLGYSSLKPFGISPDSWNGYQESHDLDLAKLSENSLDNLNALFTRFSKVRGVGVLLSDLNKWRDVLKEGASQKRARTVRQFKDLLIQHMVNVPGKRLYKQHADGAWLCYYVASITYHPPETYQRYTPARVSMHMLSSEFGQIRQTTLDFEENDCRGVPVAQALAEQDYLVEIPALRKDYLAAINIYHDVIPRIGKQYWAKGKSTKLQNDDWWARYSSNVVALDRYGDESRVVVDVFSEEDEKARSKSYVDTQRHFWPLIEKKTHYDPLKDEDPDGDIFDKDDFDLESPEIEIPIHPWVCIFHLGKHLRLKCHVRQLREYKYDTAIADKLVLPDDDKALVKLLIETKGGAFQDIVQNKGGGAVILLTGAPGTGKTLTAEVYAESEERALYSVQCSQLGTSPDKLEEALMKVFDRARRWNAVMLLDEADVYVHERGNNMAQNAIVGVFLRVLEYQNSILFLTTNRANDVDDAIASRCIARLHYTAPDADRAARIWRVLADGAGIALDDEVIHDIVTFNPGMTGRDIKNILKLASLMPDGVTADTVAYVQQFKPTATIKDE